MFVQQQRSHCIHLGYFLCGCCSWVVLFLTWIMLFPRCRYQRSWTRAYTIGSTDSSIKLAGISTLDDVVDTYQENGIPTQFGLNTTVQVNSYERYVWHLKLLKLCLESFWKLCSFKPICFSGVFFPGVFISGVFISGVLFEPPASTTMVNTINGTCISM